MKPERAVRNGESTLMGALVQGKIAFG